MQISAEAHVRSIRAASLLSVAQVKDMIEPLEVIRVFNQENIRFVLVGAHGIAGWMNKPRATQDVDFVIMEKHLKKARKAIESHFPQFLAEDTEVVIRFRNIETQEVGIDLIKQRHFLREIFKHTTVVQEEDQEYQIPNVEMALTMKFAAMISPNRLEEDRYQDAHDFIRIAKESSVLDPDRLEELGALVYDGGGEELVEMVRKAKAGEKLNL